MGPLRSVFIEALALVGFGNVAGGKAGFEFRLLLRQHRRLLSEDIIEKA